VCASSGRRPGEDARRGDDVAGGPLPLAVRRRLAELILEAFESAEARATLGAVARACGASGGAGDPGDAGRLVTLGWFEPVAPGEVRLRGAHRAYARTLGDRAGRAVSAVAGWRDRQGEGMERLLDRAAALAARGLFFEVHELLEPAWFRAGEPARTALQGLIQAAVAFHHLENGNLRGARSLLGEAVVRLAERGHALPLDAAPWLAALRAVLATLAAGGRPAAIPCWPRPAGPEETRWRSC
jgi:hypothetical protein